MALLLQGAQRRLRILCAREVQKSLRESVHHLLCEQIERLGLGRHYTILESEIRGANGTNIIFSGLSDHTAASIKSYEGVDICWVEEAQAVSKRSWDILLPTIRQPGSEVWVSLNPEMDTDETWQRFVVAPPPGAVVQRVTYADNPWLSPELEAERKHCEATQPEDYPCIWLGEPRAAVAGAIYARELLEAAQAGRLCPVPYHPSLKVHVVFDLGWSMACGLWQVHMGALRGIGYLEQGGDTRRDLAWFAGSLRDLRLNFGTVWLPHDGFTEAYQTGVSAEAVMRAHGFAVRRVPSLPVEAGIQAARLVLRRTWFDQVQCAGLIEHLKRYRRAVHRDGRIGEPLKDGHDHAADMYRYTALVAEQMSNEAEQPGPVIVPPMRPRVPALGMLG